MPSSPKLNPFLRLLLGGAAALTGLLLLVLLQSAGPGYAAPPAGPDAKHRTPTVTPTPTRTARAGEVNTQSTGDVEIDPFIGFESVPAALTQLRERGSSRGGSNSMPVME